MEKCKYFDILDPVFADRAASRPLFLASSDENAVNLTDMRVLDDEIGDDKYDSSDNLSDDGSLPSASGTLPSATNNAPSSSAPSSPTPSATSKKRKNHQDDIVECMRIRKESQSELINYLRVSVKRNILQVYID